MRVAVAGEGEQRGVELRQAIPDGLEGSLTSAAQELGKARGVPGEAVGTLGGHELGRLPRERRDLLPVSDDVLDCARGHPIGESVVSSASLATLDRIRDPRARAYDDERPETAAVWRRAQGRVQGETTSERVAHERGTGRRRRLDLGEAALEVVGTMVQRERAVASTDPRRHRRPGSGPLHEAGHEHDVGGHLPIIPTAP